MVQMVRMVKMVQMVRMVEMRRWIISTCNGQNKHTKSELCYGNDSGMAREWLENGSGTVRKRMQIISHPIHCCRVADHRKRGVAH